MPAKLGVTLVGLLFWVLGVFGFGLAGAGVEGELSTMGAGLLAMVDPRTKSTARAIRMGCGVTFLPLPSNQLLKDLLPNK